MFAGSSQAEPLKILRFAAVGFLNAATGYLIFLLLMWVFQPHYLLAYIAAFGIWSWFGFSLQRLLVFLAAPRRLMYRKYLFSHLIFLPFNSVLLWLAVDVSGIPAYGSYPIVIGITAAARYLTSRYIVFK